ncbi:hypothetical protein D3C73_1218890 [compost metagenome]
MAMGRFSRTNFRRALARKASSPCCSPATSRMSPALTTTFPRGFGRRLPLRIRAMIRTSPSPHLIRADTVMDPGAQSSGALTSVT